MTTLSDIYEGDNTAPLFLQSYSGSNSFQIETQVTMSPTEDYQQAGLIIYGNDDNYIRLTYGHLAKPAFELTKEVNGSFASIWKAAPSSAFGNPLYLRIVKRDSTIYGYYSLTGHDWVLIGQRAGFYHPVTAIGLSAFGNNDATVASIPADFDYFKYVPESPLMILVHGCCAGSGDSFGLLPYWLSEDGYSVYTIDKPYGKVQFWPAYAAYPNPSYDPNPGWFDERLLPQDRYMQESALMLSSLIEDAKNQAGKLTDDKVILIAHSKGGLVSRMYLESNLYWRRDVSRVIMFGTPNAGSPLADMYVSQFLCVDKIEYCEFTYEAMGLFNNHYQTRALGVEYDLIAGDVALSFPRLLIWVANDTVVPVDSVYGIFGSRVGKYIRKGAHHSGGSDNGYMTRDVYLDCLRPLVTNGQTSNCTNSTRLMAAAVSEPRQIANFAGQIGTGQTLTYTVQIDSSESSLFHLIWPDGDLGFTLTDPVGTNITPILAEGDANIEYNASPITDTVFINASYIFTTTTSGLWTLEIAGNNTNGQNVAFAAVVKNNSDLGLTTSTDKSNYALNEGAIITGTLNGNTGGVAGTIITVTIQRPDAVSHTLTLHDDGTHNDGSNGDGIYGNTYNQTVVSGYYGVAAQATGSRSGIPFERSAQTLFTVNSDNAVLNGIYNDVPKDDDGNGLYENLEITAGVDTVVAGNYSIAVLLKDNTGTVIANQVVHVDLVVGSNTVSVLFGGDIIRAYGVDGPYTVAEVHIADNSGVALLADESFDVWTTAAYKYSQFGLNLEEVYLPIILK